jgi:hypothetical protein
MNPNILRPDIDAIETTHISATDNKVVNLSIPARVHGEVERWSINHLDIMNRKVGDLDKSQNSGALNTAFCVILVPVALKCSSASGAEDFHVITTLD